MNKKMKQYHRHFLCLIFTVLLVLGMAGCTSVEPQPEVSASTENTASSDTQTFAKKDPLYVIFNFDVEDNRGSEPYLIEGDLSEFGIEENCGVDYIMDTFDTYGAKACFFTNVYEYQNYDSDGAYMTSLLQRMNERGFEIGLHTHPNQYLDFYKKVLTACSYEEQVKILQFGIDFVENAIGKKPVVHRGGSYRVNDETFAALKQVGCPIDSSFWKGNAFNEFTERYRGKNLGNQNFYTEEGVVEIPVINLFNGSEWRKLDLEWLSVEEIINCFEFFYESEDYNCVQIMGHSFSFSRLHGEPGEIPLVQDGNKSIYGPKYVNKKKLEALLDYISKTDNIEIVTFEEYLKLNLDMPELGEDGSPIYLANEHLAFQPSDILAERSGSLVTLRNSFEGSVPLQYNYVTYNERSEKVDTGEYTDSPEYTIDFLGKSGTFTVKAYVRDDNDNRSSCFSTEIVVEDGKIIQVTVL